MISKGSLRAAAILFTASLLFRLLSLRTFDLRPAWESPSPPPPPSINDDPSAHSSRSPSNDDESNQGRKEKVRKSEKATKPSNVADPPPRRKAATAAMLSFIPHGAHILFVGAGDIADLYTGLCHEAHKTEAGSTRWCPTFEDHIHDEFLRLPGGGGEGEGGSTARFLYWDAQSSLDVAPFLCGKPSPVKVTTSTTTTTTAAPGWAWPTHVIFGRGILDLFHLNPSLEDLAGQTGEALQHLSTLGSGREAFCSGKVGKEERKIPLTWVLPRFVPERPFHVGCTTEARQVELLDRLASLARAPQPYSDTTRLVDLWTPSRAWPNDVFDWRGLAPRKTSRFVKLTRLAIEGAFASAAESKPLATLADAGMRLQEMLGEIKPSKLFSIGWGRSGGGRHCSSERSMPIWFANDSQDRRQPTKFWTYDRGVSWRVPPFRFGPPTRWLKYDKELTRAITERLPFPPGGENVSIHYDGAPCGSVPTPYDERWQYNIRQLGTRWPIKTLFVEVPCLAMQPNPSPPSEKTKELVVEPLGPPRCAFVWGPAEETDNNWPEIDLEGCLAHGQVRPLIIGSSHQDPRDLQRKWFQWQRSTTDRERHSDVVAGAKFSARDTETKDILIDGVNVMGFRWNTYLEGDAIRNDAPLSRKWTHILLGTASWGNIFRDWTPSQTVKQVFDWLKTASQGAKLSPDEVQFVAYLELHFRGRPARVGFTDPCAMEYRIEMYRESMLCATADFFRNWNASQPAEPGSIRSNGSNAYRTGLRYFNPKPMTKHRTAELLSPVWDGHHHHNFPIGESLIYHPVRLMCNEWISEKTTARPLRINGRDGFGFTADEDRSNPAVALPSVGGGFPELIVQRMPPDTPPLEKQWKRDPRHRGLPETTLCGCKGPTVCGRTEDITVGDWEWIAVARGYNSPVSEKQTAWDFADERFEVMKKWWNRTTTTTTTMTTAEPTTPPR